MKYDVEIALENLNAEHCYKYHERSRDLDDEDDKFYYVSVFLDNHDWEHFENFEIPKSEISRDELDGYLGVLC